MLGRHLGAQRGSRHVTLVALILGRMVVQPNADRGHDEPGKFVERLVRHVEPGHHAPTELGAVGIERSGHFGRRVAQQVEPIDGGAVVGVEVGGQPGHVSDRGRAPRKQP